MVLQPTVHEDGVVQCNVISITHHDAPVGFVPISLLISLHWDNIKATKKRRVFRQALKSSRGWAEAGLRRPFWLHKSVSILFVPVNANCTEIVCRDKTADPLFFFFFCESLLKTCCLWTKWACNHIDHRDRKCSVLPFNLFMASEQNWILSALAR